MILLYSILNIISKITYQYALPENTSNFPFSACPKLLILARVYRENQESGYIKNNKLRQYKFCLREDSYGK
jgi:hypothetical protein